MVSVIGKFIANILRVRLEYLYDMEKAEGTSDYLKGRKEGTLLVLQDICDYLHSAGVINARQFIKEAVPIGKG